MDIIGLLNPKESLMQDVDLAIAELTSRMELLKRVSKNSVKTSKFLANSLNGYFTATNYTLDERYEEKEPIIYRPLEILLNRISFLVEIGEDKARLMEYVENLYQQKANEFSTYHLNDLILFVLSIN